MSCSGDLSGEDAILAGEELTAIQGNTFNLRCRLQVKSTLLIFDVYSKTTNASFPPAVRAVAIDEGDGESSEPDLDGTVRIKLEWSYVSEGVTPPKEFQLSGCSDKNRKSILCVGTTKKREL